MNFIRRWMQRRKNVLQEQDTEAEQTIQRENPYLPYLREILEKILKMRELGYGKMRLVVIDTDMDTESVFFEDDVMRALEQLSPDLNFCIILTERPAYFQEYVEKMYEETGLPILIEYKNSYFLSGINTVLDFEQQGSIRNLKLEEPSIYLPIYKKRWETLENLDISVPIGYNTVIVKGIGAV